MKARFQRTGILLDLAGLCFFQKVSSSPIYLLLSEKAHPAERLLAFKDFVLESEEHGQDWVLYVVGLVVYLRMTAHTLGFTTRQDKADPCLLCFEQEARGLICLLNIH